MENFLFFTPLPKTIKLCRTNISEKMAHFPRQEPGMISSWEVKDSSGETNISSMVGVIKSSLVVGVATRLTSLHQV